MRILVFYQYFCTPEGSWGTRWYEFARRWVKAGHEVRIITSPYEKSDIRSNRWLDHQDIEGIRVTLIGRTHSNRQAVWRRVLGFFQYAFIASFYAIWLKSDVVISSSGPITIGIPGWMAKTFRHRKWIFEVRDLWPEGAIQLGLLRRKPLIRLARRFEKKCYSRADQIVALSPGMREGILRVTAQKEVAVIPNSSDIHLVEENLAPDARPHSGKYLVYTGSLGLMDDAEQLLFWGRIIQSNWPEYTFVVIGDGVDRAKIQKAIQAEGLSRFIYLGPLAKTEVFRWLAGARAAVIAYKQLQVLDTVSPNKLFDAFACGTPVLHSTQGWLKEHSAKQGWGLTVLPFDHDSFQRAMAQIDKDEKHAALKLASLEMGRTEFNREILSQKYLSLLTELVEARD